jgi:hypothetical protein
MATTYPASANQLKLIATLAAERKVPLPAKPATWAEAKKTIAYLIALPKPQLGSGMIPQWADLAGLPISKFVLVDEAGVMRFYELVERKGGKRYLNGLVGAPGSFARRHLSPTENNKVAKLYRLDPKAAIKAFSVHYTCCAKCGAELTDAESIATGMGPICRGQLAGW